MSHSVNPLSQSRRAALAALVVTACSLPLLGCGGSSASHRAYHPPDPNAVSGTIFRLQLQTSISKQASKLGITATQVAGVVDCMISQFQSEGVNKVTSVMANHAAVEKQVQDQCVQQVKGAAGTSGTSGSGTGGSGSGASGSSGAAASGSSGSGGSGSSGSSGAGASGSSGSGSSGSAKG